MGRSKKLRARSARRKSKKACLKGDTVWHQSATEATLAKKPHYNGFACGTGVHGDVKYNRTRAKRAFGKRISLEGASMRGPFPYLVAKRYNCR